MRSAGGIQAALKPIKAAAGKSALPQTILKMPKSAPTVPIHKLIVNKAEVENWGKVCKKKRPQSF